MNNIVQASQENCIAGSVQTADGNVVIANNITVDGNFTGVSEAASVDATCSMTSSMTDVVSNILSAIVKQTNKSETDWFDEIFGLDLKNTFDISQSVTNKISQINQQTCQAQNTQSINSNYVYIPGGKIGGDFVGVSTVSNVSANCNIRNYMKNATYNQAQASGTQSNTAEGLFAVIGGIIITLLGILVLGAVLIFSGKAVSKVGYYKYEESKEKKK